jgi:tetratricopeptide (TPR) repeat protein
VLNLLQEETEGNVFFLVETVRAMAEEAGGLQSVGGTTLPESVFAGGVRRIIRRRLERVPVADRPPLKLSAVIGRALELEVLQTAYPELNLEPWLTTCANVAVLEVQDGRWRFAHDKLREALLDELPPDEQRAIHNQAAVAIEVTFRENLAPYYGRLAWHHAQADNREQERKYARLAGEHAAARYAYDEALQFFRQALEQTPEDDLAGRCELLLAQEAIFKIQGKPEARLEILQTLQSLTKTLNDPALNAQVHLRWVAYYHDRGDFSTAIEAARQALAISEMAGCADVSVKLYNWLASALWKQNQLAEARRVAEVGLELARQIENKHVESDLMGVLGMVAFAERDLETARQAFERSREIAAQSGEDRSLATALSNLGMVAGYQGDFQAAQEYYEQAIQIAETIGAREARGIYLTNLGWVLGLLGEYEQAIHRIREAIENARLVGDSYSEAYGLVNLSSCTCAIGDAYAAQDAARKAREVAIKIGDRSAEAWAFTTLGHSLLATGDFDGASEAYQKSLSIWEQSRQPLLATEPAAGLATIALEQGDLDAASRHAQKILPVMEQKPGLDGTDDPLRVYLACYRVLSAKNDPAAVEILQTAYELIQSRAANIPREQSRRAFLENIPHHRKIVRLWKQRQTQAGA